MVPLYFASSEHHASQVSCSSVSDRSFDSDRCSGSQEHVSGGARQTLPLKLTQKQFTCLFAAAGHFLLALVLLGTPWRKYRFLPVNRRPAGVCTGSSMFLDLEQSLDIVVLAAEEDLRKSTITPHEDKAMASTA